MIVRSLSKGIYSKGSTQRLSAFCSPRMKLFSLTAPLVVLPTLRVVKSFTTTGRLVRQSAFNEALTRRPFSTESENTDTPEIEITGDSLPNEYSTTYHAPVMWLECIEALMGCERSQARVEKQDGPLIFVDGTLGGGGHSNAILERLQPGDILFGCDIDPEALETASLRLVEYMEHDGTSKPHFIPVQSNFGDLVKNLPSVLHPVTKQPILSIGDDEDNHASAVGVDGILLDLGVSSHQIDTAERGFAFMKDGPLDMRMGMDQSGYLTAADLCNEMDAKELQRIFSVFGDEPRAKTVAKAVVDNRPLTTTGDLVEAISSVTPAFAKSKRRGRTATCARIFQSLRIVVNREDKVLEQVLAEACPTLLRKGGRLVVLSYHSMEDRAAKRIMRDGTLKKVRVEKDIYGNTLGPQKPFKPVGKRQSATEEETTTNPRARSASLRIADKL